MNLYDDYLDLRDLSEDHEETVAAVLAVAKNFPSYADAVADNDAEAILGHYWQDDDLMDALDAVGVGSDQAERSIWCFEIESQLGCSIEEAANNEPILIADSHFENYARELAEDLGAIPNDYSWPASHIDWEAAADSLKMDYMEITLGTYSFWTRAW